MFDKSPVRDVVVWTAMIDRYGKRVDITKARELFEKMPDRNVISWSAMMAAHSQASDFREVLSLFRQMQEVGVEPNESVSQCADCLCSPWCASARVLCSLLRQATKS